MPGDCGSWVIDLTSGQVYGMLLASSARQNCSYCLSMSEIFESIKSTLAVGTPTIFQTKERHLDQDTRSEPELAIEPTQELSSRSSRSGSEPEASDREDLSYEPSIHDEQVLEPQASDREESADLYRPSIHDEQVLEPQIAPTAIETMNAQDQSQDSSYERKSVLPTANNPDDGTPMVANNIGGTRYEIPLTKIDRTVARKLGYEMWQGETSTVIETHGQEVSELDTT